MTDVHLHLSMKGDIHTTYILSTVTFTFHRVGEQGRNKTTFFYFAEDDHLDKICPDEMPLAKCTFPLYNVN